MRYDRQRDPINAWLLASFIAAACAACVATATATRNRAVSPGSGVRFIVRHHAERVVAAARRRLTAGEVGSDYLLAAEPATVYRLVGEERRAWHAGPSDRVRYTHPDSRSIDSPIVDADDAGDASRAPAPYPAAEVRESIALVRAVERRGW